MRDFKELVKPAISLLIICFVTALLLALVNGLTRDTISARALSDAEEQRKLVMTDAESFKELSGWKDKDESGLITGVWAAYKGDGFVGYVFSASPKGYGGEMAVTVGVASGMKVSGVKLGDNKETPGLGTKAKDEEFSGQYTGMDAGIKFTVVKSKGNAADQNQILAISGATITSKAVTAAVQAAADLAAKLSENGGGSN
ncbi:MAG: RnfABCDGE type electron transport complex subunit G [Clostridiales bacterium]|nr:RnfABCDGE type electron transport complex subunit G [Clostridiales bacterium]